MFEFSQIDMWPVILVAIVLGSAIPLIAIITEHQRKARKAEMDHELKRELVAQGKTAEEIQEVLDMESQRRA